MVTWGRLQRMTWGFWDRYCDEAYCALSTDFVERGRAPNGFDLEALQGRSRARDRVKGGIMWA